MNNFGEREGGMRFNGSSVVDSYTGFSWCGRGLHLLVPENRNAKGGCLSCEARRRRRQRAKAGAR